MEHQCIALLLLCICAIGQRDASAEPTETPINTEKGKSSTVHGKVGLKERAWMLFISDDGFFGPKKGADNSRPPKGAYSQSSAPPPQVSDEAFQNSTSDNDSPPSAAAVNVNGTDSSQANATGDASQNSASRYTVIVSNQRKSASTVSPSLSGEGFYTVIVSDHKRKEKNSSAALLQINPGEMSASEIQLNGSSSRTSASPDRAGDPPFYTVIVSGSKTKESKTSAGWKHHSKGAVSASETLSNGSRSRTSLSPAGAGNPPFYTVIVSDPKKKEPKASAAFHHHSQGATSTSEMLSYGPPSRTSISPGGAGNPPFYTVIVSDPKKKGSKGNSAFHQHNQGAISASETLLNGPPSMTSRSPSGDPPFYTVIVSDQKKKGSKASAASHQHSQGAMSASEVISNGPPSRTSISPGGGADLPFYTVIVTDPKNKESNSSGPSEQTIQGAMSASETLSNGSLSMTSLSPGGAGGPPFYTVIVTNTKGKESNVSEQHFQGDILPSETPSSGSTSGMDAGSSGGGLSHVSTTDFSGLGGSFKGVSIGPDMSPVINIINGIIAPHRGIGWSSAGSPRGDAVSSHEKSKKLTGKFLKSPPVEHGVHHHSHPAPGRQEHHIHISSIKSAFAMLHGKETQKKEKPPLLGSGRHEGSFLTQFSSSQSKATKSDIATGGASTTIATPTTVTYAPSKTPTSSTSERKPVGGGYVQAVVAFVQNFKVDPGGIKN